MGEKNFSQLTEMFDRLVGIKRRVVVSVFRRDDTKRSVYKTITSRFSERVACANCEGDWSYRCVRVDGLPNRRYQKFKSTTNC